MNLWDGGVFFYIVTQAAFTEILLSTCAHMCAVIGQPMFGRGILLEVPSLFYNHEFKEYKTGFQKPKTTFKEPKSGELPKFQRLRYRRR